MAKTNISDFIELGHLAEQVLGGKDFFVGHVADRLRRASDKFPHDQAIKAMQKIMDNKFSKEGSLALVSQKEVQDIYEEVRGLGSPDSFKSELGDLLYDATQQKVAYHNDDHIKGLRGHGTAIDLANQEMVSEFSNLFGASDGQQKSAFVENGKNGVKLELMSMGFDNPSVEVAAKDSSFVIYAAEIDTAYGRTPFLIPAEIKLGSVLLPSVFVSGNEFLDFTRENILQNAIKIRGSGRTSTPKAVLATLNKLVNKSSVVKNASAEDFGDATPSSTLSSPGLYSNISEEVYQPNLEYQKVEMPSELKELGESFIKETLAEAGLTFSRNTVLKAKSMLSTELSALGIQHDKVVIASEWANGIIFTTNIRSASGTKTIEVPVEILNDTVLMPSTFVSGTTVQAFNNQNLVALANAREDSGFNTAISSYSDMSFKELYVAALKSAAFGNFVDTEECLAVIQDKFGPEFHKTAFGDLMELIRVGFNSTEESPVDAIDSYIKEAVDAAAFKENNIKVSNSLMYLYPEDDRKKD